MKQRLDEHVPEFVGSLESRFPRYHKLKRGSLGLLTDMGKDLEKVGQGRVTLFLVSVHLADKKGNFVLHFDLDGVIKTSNIDKNSEEVNEVWLRMRGGGIL